MRTLFQRVIDRLGPPQPAPREVIASVGDPFVDVLCSMYDGEPQLGVDGKTYAIDPKVSIGTQEGMFIYHLVRQTKPENSLEIGLASGFSTIYFLAAIQANGRGRHIAVDPFEYEWWNGVGLTREQVLGTKRGIFEFSQETSVQALARFDREHQRFGLILIDGYHTFDAVLIDFSLASLVCESDAYIIIDDMWMPSIQRAVSFIRLNRADFKAVPTPLKRLAVFKRTDTDKRRWDHFVPF